MKTLLTKGGCELEALFKSWGYIRFWCSIYQN